MAIVIVSPFDSFVSEMKLADVGIGATAAVIAPIGDAVSREPLEHAVAAPSAMTAQIPTTKALEYLFIVDEPSFRLAAVNSGPLHVDMRWWPARHPLHRHLATMKDVTSTSRVATSGALRLAKAHRHRI
jgi:hypothetical protein